MLVAAVEPKLSDIFQTTVNGRFGSLADLFSKSSLMAAFGVKAAVQLIRIVSSRQAASSQKQASHYWEHAAYQCQT